MVDVDDALYTGVRVLPGERWMLSGSTYLVLDDRETGAGDLVEIVAEDERRLCNGPKTKVKSFLILRQLVVADDL